MSASNLAARDAQADSVRRRRPNLVLSDGETPDGALTWENGRDRPWKLKAWRLGVGDIFHHAALPVRLAWVLEWTFAREGYCPYPDRWFAREMSVPLTSVERGMSKLERGKAIIRAHLEVGPNAFERRIFPAEAIAKKRLDHPLSERVGRTHEKRPDFREIPPAQRAGHNIHRKPRISSTAHQARLAAEIRDRRERESGATLRAALVDE